MLQTRNSSSLRRRLALFGAEIDPLTQAEAVSQVLEWVEDLSFRCRYVVTPNVDHTLLLRESGSLRKSYADADLVLADGFPLVLASRLLGKPLPERVTGSDLVPAVFDRAERCAPLRVFLLGAAPGVADQAATHIENRWSAVRVVGCYSPPLGFEKDPLENREIVERINAVRPEILILGLGAPKQEIWIHQFRDRLQAKVALCVGATIDFLAGHRRRAPRWMQRCGLEWFYRMCSEPKRLVKRYAKDAWYFPQIVYQQWRADRRRA